MAGIGWYGPLINLSAASAHIGDFVQLLVFVHQFHPPQRLRSSTGRELLKSTLRVGDNTQTFFDVSLWQNFVDSNVSAGDIILLQNVKVTKFRDVIAATTVPYSSLSVLVKARELLSSHGIDETLGGAQGRVAKEKMKIVISWAKFTQSTLLSYLDAMREYNKRPYNVDTIGTLYKNWLCSEKSKLKHCLSISEDFCLKELSLVRFFGKIGEICLPCTARNSGATLSVEDWIFVSRSFLRQSDKKLTKAFICRGCKNCGYPMEGDNSRSFSANQMTMPLYCGNNVNQIHCIGWIYRPFLLHVWDQTANISVLVKNLAAAQLFANIPAESVFQSLEAFSLQNVGKRTEAGAIDINNLMSGDFFYQYTRCTSDFKGNDEGATARDISIEEINVPRRVNQQTEGNQSAKMIDFSTIFSILLRTLLRKDENSPFEFQVLIHPDTSGEQKSYVFELVSFKMFAEA